MTRQETDRQTNLHEMCILSSLLIIPLRMPNARPRTSVLHFSSLERFHIPHRITMTQLSIEDIREDLVCLVRMRWEARLRLDSIFVDDAERTKGRPGFVVVAGKRECQKGAKPPVVVGHSVVPAP